MLPVRCGGRFPHLLRLLPAIRLKPYSIQQRTWPTGKPLPFFGMLYYNAPQRGNPTKSLYMFEVFAKIITLFFQQR